VGADHSRVSSGPDPSRRDVLASSGAGLAAFLCKAPRAAGARQGGPDEFPIPAEKNFSEAWRRSLFERGEPLVARGDELRWIGMPVGGIGCGQLYLGGDGRLWWWDLFNLPGLSPTDSGAGQHYAKPLEPEAGPLSFLVRAEWRGGGSALALSRVGFPEVEFRGTYPIGTVTYRSHAPALEVELEAFSPFVPLELEDSSLPATLLTFRLRNTGEQPLSVTLRGSLDNPVLRSTPEESGDYLRSTTSVRTDEIAMLVHGAEAPPEDEARPDILFEDFERRDYTPWTVEGTAFGAGPVVAAEMPAYQGTVGAEGARLAHSHHTRAGEDIAAADAHVGTLTSRSFPVERAWIHCLLGGGAHPAETGIEVLVDDEVVATATGANENRLMPRALFVGAYEGQQARIRIFDRAKGAWGNVGVDSIVFSDRASIVPLAQRPDFGTLAFGLVSEPEAAELVLPRPSKEEYNDPGVSERGFVARRFELAPGAAAEAVYVLAWHFPNLARGALAFLPGIEARRRHYAARFADAGAVARYVATERERLAAATRAWRDAWNDSTLPHWFLTRTLASASTLATSTVVRLDDGRFHGSEGVGCGPGTCTHVWHYSQAAARLFPALERDQRERVDLGLAFHGEPGRADTGQIDYRAEAGRELAVDGQAGTILRVLREHQTAPDDAFLRRVWPRVKTALECLLARDPDQDGILSGPQYNTLDTPWYGAIPWLSSMYLAALRAGESMARELGDEDFAARCRRVLDAGAKTLVARLFDGERFVQELDPAHPESNSSGRGTFIDQVLGQSWAHQVGLGRVLPEAETRHALQTLFRDNFAPDVGPYRKYMEARIPGGRWYALAGEAGLVMCTWPKGGAEAALGKGGDSWAASYFNECMSGFEHQAAGHMLWEGLVEEGLAVERAIHDRYHPSKRNPYDEIEYGDHYARAMASYGVFLAASGFELHGPRAHLGFAPRLAPEKFRAAFVGAEGWGSYAQEIDAAKALSARIELRHGRLRLATLRIGHAGKADASRVTARLGEKELACTRELEPASVLVRFAEPAVLAPGDVLAIRTG
jgi:uncharacterized protein (DUF608 family)